MLLAEKKAPKPAKVKTTYNNSWIGGVVSALDDGRTPQKGLLYANNMILTQDGVMRPRPSLSRYLPQPTGTVKGRTFLFQSRDGLDGTNRLINLQKSKHNEVQTLSISGTPTGGTFTLTYGSDTTDAIDYNATASDVQTALEALTSIGADNVECSGGSLPGTNITITFQGDLADTDVGLITSTDSLTGGTSPATSLAETTKGGEYVTAFIAKPEDTEWTEVSGKTFDDDSYGEFFQIANKVPVLTGKDKFSFFDISTVGSTPTITTYNKIDDVDEPTSITSTGSDSLTDGTTNYTIYYAVTANSTVGQTTGTAKSVDINKQRNGWDSTKNALKIEWTKVDDAKSYNIYCGVANEGQSNPDMVLLESNLSADTAEYTDDGSLALANFVSMPTSNSTEGPVTSHGTEIAGRCWLWGDTTDASQVYFGGSYGHELTFNGTNGSGTIHVGSGASEIPKWIGNFRSGPGDPEIKALSSDSVSDGKRYTLSQHQVSLGPLSATTWGVSEDYGQTGTSSRNGVAMMGNSLYFFARGGFQTTGTKPQLQNLLDTSTVTDTILPDLAGINWDVADKFILQAHEGRLYWCLAVGTDYNNQIWVLDIQRGGAWTKVWNIEADDMFLVVDNSGRTHLTVLSNNNFYELSYDNFTSDDGTPVITSGSTGLNYFSKDGRMWVSLVKFIVTVLRPVGRANFTLLGFTEDEKLEPIGSGSFDEKLGATNGYGWGEAAWGENAWSETNDVPPLTGRSSVDVEIELEKRNIRYWQLQWDSVDAGVDYGLSKTAAAYVEIGIKNLS